MTGADIFDALGELDIELIEEAERHNFKRKTTPRAVYALIAAAASLVILLPSLPFLSIAFKGCGAAAGELSPDCAPNDKAETEQTETPGDALTGSAECDNASLVLEDGADFTLELVSKGEETVYLLTNCADVIATAELENRVVTTYGAKLDSLPEIEPGEVIEYSIESDFESEVSGISPSVTHETKSPTISELIESLFQKSDSDGKGEADNKASSEDAVTLKRKLRITLDANSSVEIRIRE